MTRLSSLQDIHHDRFGPAQYHVHAPGRINLIGEHTDYNHGYVLPAATDRGIHFLFNFKSALDAYDLYSKNLDDHQTFYKNRDRKSTRLNSSHVAISYAVFCLQKKKHAGSVGDRAGAHAERHVFRHR